MVIGLWNSAKANKENIVYTIVTIFLLERVRRGWNRLEACGRAHNVPAAAIERRQQWFMFRAALLYAVPFLLPVVKYIFRSLNELSQYVAGLGVLSSLWGFFFVLVVVEGFLAVILYNLLGIYVERMNAALGLFRRMGRSVLDGSRLAVQAGARAGDSARRGVVTRAVGLASRTRALAGYSVRSVQSAPNRLGAGSRWALAAAKGVSDRVKRSVVPSHPFINR